MATDLFPVQQDPIKYNKDQVASKKVSLKWLLALYSIIPLCLILQLIDRFLFSGTWLNGLPTAPQHFILFQFLFGTPHIIASAIIITSNDDYFHHYKRRLFLMSLFIMLFFGLTSLFLPYRFLYILVASVTVFHVLKQQFGLARGVCKLPDIEFYTLLILSLSAGILIYMGIFLYKVLTVNQAEIIQWAAGLICLFIVLISFYCQRYSNSIIGKGFLWGNTLLVISSFYLYQQNYFFLAILVPRLIHDATAFYCYVVHDYNKHHGAPKNLLYKVAQKVNLSCFVVLPITTLGLTFILQSYGDAYFNQLTMFLFGTDFYKAISVGFIGYLGLMHYYTESFTWKKNSPYKAFIAFK